jgi:hypothetical protein
MHYYQIRIHAERRHTTAAAGCGSAPQTMSLRAGRSSSLQKELYLSVVAGVLPDVDHEHGWRHAEDFRGHGEPGLGTATLLSTLKAHTASAALGHAHPPTATGATPVANRIPPSRAPRGEYPTKSGEREIRWNAFSVSSSSLPSSLAASVG